MKKTVSYLVSFLIIASGILLYSACSCQGEMITSYFNNDDEGWTVVGDAQKGSSTPDYTEEGGHPGGYISADDNVAGGVWYWNAPEKFLDDRSSSYGKKISFSLKQSSTNNQFDASDIILFGDGEKIVFDLPDNPDLTWTSYMVELDENAGWRYNNLNGDTVSKDDFYKIMTDLTAIHIRGEYVTGTDTGGLDTVILYI